MAYQPRDWREGRRLRALELFLRGWRARDIADALGVSEAAVSQWLKRFREQGGKRALRNRSKSGRPPRLSPEQLKALEELLEQDPTSFGFTGRFWTGKRVATMIRRTFKISFHPDSATRLARRLGFSFQKPAQRATQRKEATIRYWRYTKWARIKKKPGRKNEPSSS
jgi:transposase